MSEVTPELPVLVDGEVDDAFETYATYATAGSRRARQHAHKRAICERLGLDPAETTEISVDIEPGGPARVRWSGVRRVPLEDVHALVAPPEREAQS